MRFSIRFVTLRRLLVARRRVNQLIDLALYEAPFRITSDLVAAFETRGAVRERIGNRNPTFTPAGTFETKDGRYVQIAAGGDNVFARLAEAMDHPEWITDERYATSAARNERADEMEQLVADWVAAHDFAEIEARLVERNVPAGGIYTARDIVADPHFMARDSFIRVPDDTAGNVAMPGVIPKLMGTPGEVRSAGPELGSHNNEIYGGLLGRSEQEIEQLESNGVI